MQKEGGTAWGRRSLESRQERRSVEREIQNYRDDSEQLGSSTGREWRAGESERARKKTELLHRANVCACLEITRREEPSIPLCPAKRVSFALFLPVGINPCWCGLELRLRVEVNSRVHLRSTRWIIQRCLNRELRKKNALNRRKIVNFCESCCSFNLSERVDELEFLAGNRVYFDSKDFFHFSWYYIFVKYLFSWMILKRVIVHTIVAWNID